PSDLTGATAEAPNGAKANGRSPAARASRASADAMIQAGEPSNITGTTTAASRAARSITVGATIDGTITVGVTTGVTPTGPTATVRITDRTLFLMVTGPLAIVPAGA